MPKKKQEKTFKCTKCHHTFLCQESFYGRCSMPYDEVYEVKLCSRCLIETNALWNGETKTIEREINEKIEYHTSRHGIDKYADAKRTAIEEISDFLTNHCLLFNGENGNCSNNRDLTHLEKTARRIIHDDFKINCEQQPQVYGSAYSYRVDGLIETKGRSIVLEFDGRSTVLNKNS